MLIRVFEIPAPDGRFCFGAGKPMTFTELDWFRDDGMPEGYLPDDIVDFVTNKRYARGGRPLLVLTESWSVTINYRAP